MAQMSTTQGNDVQSSIVRQSQLKLVLDYATMMGIKLPLADLVGISVVMTDFCLNGWSPELRKRIEACDQHIQSIIGQMVVE